MDYPHRARLKIYARVEQRSLEGLPELAAALAVPDQKGRAERAVLLRLETFDWNCPQHITPRFTEAEIAEAVLPLHRRIEQLEAENEALRSKITAADGSTERI